MNVFQLHAFSVWPSDTPMMKKAIDKGKRICDSYRNMRKRKVTLSELLKQAIADSGKTWLELERETGVARDSILRFMRGDQSLRMDKGEMLATYFGIRILPPKRRMGKGK